MRAISIESGESLPRGRALTMGTLHLQTFAALLRRFRRAAGLTQAELAEGAGLSPEAISALERGVNRTPRRETVDLLADALALAGEERARFEQSARQRGAPPALQSIVPAPAQVGIPLIDRAAELTLIERLLSGHLPPALVLEGEPGIGKTRLLYEAAALASATGWTV